MSSRDPLVSVVVPSFNQARFLAATLNSLLAQDYTHLETLVIDGGSTDGSLDILRRLGPRLSRCISEVDAGQTMLIDSPWMAAGLSAAADRTGMRDSTVDLMNSEVPFSFQSQGSPYA